MKIYKYFKISLFNLKTPPKIATIKIAKFRSHEKVKVYREPDCFHSSAA